MNAESVTRNWQRLPHPVRWVAAAAVGGTLVVVGLILMVLPGPGIPILLLGLLVLASEFAWAQATLHRVKKHGATAGRVARDAARKVRRQKPPTMSA